MKPDIKKIQEITNRLQLLAPSWYYDTLNKAPELIDEMTNGVGSETHWSYHFIPDTNWFLNMCPISHPHDVMYALPYEFKTVGEGLAWKRLADHWFYLNGIILIEDRGGLFKRARRSRLNKYDLALNMVGSEAFWANKHLPDDYFKYYSEEPYFDGKMYAKYKEIWSKIFKLKGKNYEIHKSDM